MNNNLKSIWLDWSYEREQCYDICWVFKLKTNKLQMFGINSEKRIKQK